MGTRVFCTIADLGGFYLILHVPCHWIARLDRYICQLSFCSQASFLRTHFSRTTQQFKHISRMIQRASISEVPAKDHFERMLASRRPFARPQDQRYHQSWRWSLWLRFRSYGTITVRYSRVTSEHLKLYGWWYIEHLLPRTSQISAIFDADCVLRRFLSYGILK